MPYGPHAADDRARMLEAIGSPRRRPVRRHPRGPPRERAPARRARARAPPRRAPPGARGRNRVDLASFLGAGAYRHWSPPTVDQMLLRGEWYTAYTPYQPEVSQGTLQSIYEYQSLLAELTAMDVVSASHYDGGAATAEAALMTCRATRRDRILVSRGVHPHYRETLATYVDGAGLDGRRDPARRGRARSRARPTSRRSSGCSPTRTGRSPASSSPSRTSSACSRTCPRSAASPTRRARCSWRSIEPVSLAVLAPPGEYGADIAAGEGQPLGIPLNFGGPYLASSPAPTRWSARSRAGWWASRPTSTGGARS